MPRSRSPLTILLSLGLLGPVPSPAATTPAQPLSRAEQNQATAAE
jgi:hypothetical protein